MPSDSIAELPVKKAAVNFVTAMRRFPMIAAKIAVNDSVAPSRFVFFFGIKNGPNLRNAFTRIPTSLELSQQHDLPSMMRPMRVDVADDFGPL
jgi:hypothetical protein